MKRVGSRREPAVVEHASGELLAEGARFNEMVAKLSPTTFVPKGIYRFRSHDEANRHELECLARGMARVAAGRK
jgi:hypothetical protein